MVTVLMEVMAIPGFQSWSLTPVEFCVLKYDGSSISEALLNAGFLFSGCASCSPSFYCLE